MDKLRVLVSFLSDASLSDGCVGHTASLIRAFEACDCEVDVVTLSSSGKSLIGGTLLGAFPPSPRGMASAAIATIAAARRRGANLLVCTSLGAPFNPFIAALAAVSGTPVLYDCQDPPIETMDLLFGHTPRGAVLRRAVALLDRMLRKSVRWTFTVSDGVTEILRRHTWRMPILKFYNVHGIEGASPDGPIMGYRNDYGWNSSLVLIYAGGLQPKIRGVETQIEAVACARKAGIDAKFIAFGRGEIAPFEKLAQDLGISAHVKFPGEIPRERLHSALREADIAVMSTLPFALPSKVFEYLACGLSVICNADNRDILEAFGKDVFPFDGSAESLAAALTERSLHKVEPKIRGALQRFADENAASVRTICDALRERVTACKSNVSAAGVSRRS